jgi:hypothetical protein
LACDSAPPWLLTSRGLKLFAAFWIRPMMTIL